MRLPPCRSANKINLHAVTTNPTVFAGLPGVYGIVPTSSELTTALFQSYKISTIHKVRPNGTPGTHDIQGERLPDQFCSHGEATGKGHGSIGTQWLCQDAQLRRLLPRAQVAIVFRSDNDELAAACMAAQLNAKQNLVTYMDLSFTARDDLTNVTLAINASDVDALVACVTSTDASDMYRRLDAMRRPLKNIMFTHGPSSSTWNAALGSISGVRHAAATAVMPAPAARMIRCIVRVHGTMPLFQRCCASSRADAALARLAP